MAEDKNKKISSYFNAKLAPIYDYQCRELPKLDMNDYASSTTPDLENITRKYEYETKLNNEILGKPNKPITIDWSPVIGYDKIKEAMTLSINSTYEFKKVHILLVGAAGTSKTVFLKTIETSLKQQKLNVHYLDATTLTSSGVIEYIFQNNIKYGLLDEIDKLEKEHQKTFLNLLESGLLQETKNRKIRKKYMDETIWIATGNYEDKILYPLKTRMQVYRIPDYTETQFYEIGTKLLIQQYAKTEEIATYIVKKIWELYQKSSTSDKPNLRDAVRIAILTYKKPDEKQLIDSILEGMKQYSNTHYE